MSFEKVGRVSLWYSTTAYDAIPDSYFDEDEQGLCAWAHHYQTGQYDHDNLETNGAESGLVSAHRAIGECSYSADFADEAAAAIKALGAEKVSWVILLFDFDYQLPNGVAAADKYVEFVGSFAYRAKAESVYRA